MGRGGTRLGRRGRRRSSRRGSCPAEVSSRGMASWGDLPAIAPHMLAGTWAKTAVAMRPRMSVHTSLTSVVAQTMGRQFPGCAQSPFL